MAPLRLLVIEDQAERASAFATLAREAFGSDVEVTITDRAAEAGELLKEREVDAVILDPTLPDEWGFDALVRIRAQAVAVPIVVAACAGFEDFAAAALGAGSDATLADCADAAGLRDAVLGATARRRAAAPGAGSIDDETGLRSRAALDALLPEWTRLAVLADKEILLFHARIAGYPSGHGEATQLEHLRETAAILRDTFRGSDFVARLDENEFVAIALVHEGDGTDDIIAMRLDEQLRTHSARGGGSQRLDFAMTRVALPQDLTAEQHAGRVR
ncbi:MAG: response regulator, partial [Thermoanaerobaculia bacterium]